MVVLTGAERDKLERAGWLFATADEMREVFAAGQLLEAGATGGCG